MPRPKKQVEIEPQKPNPRRTLTDWIQAYYIKQGWDKNDINWQMISAQLKNIEADNKISDAGVGYTLWYMSDIQGINLIADTEDGYNGSVLNLVPFYIQDAQKFYNRSQAIKSSVEAFEFPEDKIIKSKPIKKPKQKVAVDFD